MNRRFQGVQPLAALLPEHAGRRLGRREQDLKVPDLRITGELDDEPMTTQSKAPLESVADLLNKNNEKVKRSI